MVDWFKIDVKIEISSRCPQNKIVLLHSQIFCWKLLFLFVNRTPTALRQFQEAQPKSADKTQPYKKLSRQFPKDSKHSPEWSITSRSRSLSSSRSVTKSDSEILPALHAPSRYVGSCIKWFSFLSSRRLVLVAAGAGSCGPPTLPWGSPRMASMLCRGVGTGAWCSPAAAGGGGAWCPPVGELERELQTIPSGPWSCCSGQWPLDAGGLSSPELLLSLSPAAVLAFTEDADCCCACILCGTNLYAEDVLTAPLMSSSGNMACVAGLPPDWDDKSAIVSFKNHAIFLVEIRRQVPAETRTRDWMFEQIFTRRKFFSRTNLAVYVCDFARRLAQDSLRKWFSRHTELFTVTTGILSSDALLSTRRTFHYWTHEKVPNMEGGASVTKRPMAYAPLNAGCFRNYTAMINVLLLGTSWFW